MKGKKKERGGSYKATSQGYGLLSVIVTRMMITYMVSTCANTVDSHYLDFDYLE